MKNFNEKWIALLTKVDSLIILVNNKNKKSGLSGGRTTGITHKQGF
jgi:hypothetical protein